MADIRGLRAYLRTDEPDEDLGLFLEAAKSYATDAGVAEREGSPKYDLLIYMLACHWYDNRGVEAVGTSVSPFSLSANSLILQLRTEVSEDD